ncbi:MAG: DUF4340 domain-containing protein, partial [Candidatus Riflebacteria bacterium]|nr:DUF4340 domain-containing protein [Candidatus Riflebacteria bacterium]
EKLDSLLNRLEKVKGDRLVEDVVPGKKIDLAQYGLDKPLYKVTWKAGTEQTLFIGKDSPLGSNAYVKTGADDKVYLVNSGDLDILKKDLFTFRDKTVLKADKDQIKEVQVTKAGGEKWRFTHATDGTWSIEEPFKAPGDSQVLGDLVNDLGRLRAEEFTCETTADLKPFSLDPPEMTAKLVFKDDGATKTVLFGKRKETDSNRMYVKRESEPIVYLIDATLVKALGNKPDEFRDKTVFRIGDRELASVTVERQGQKVTAGKGKDGRWSYEASRMTSDPGSSLTMLQDKLKELKAARFVTGADVKPSEFGLDKPDYVVRLSLAARAPTTATTGAKPEPAIELAARVGKTVETGRYVQFENDPAVVVTKEDFVSQLDGFLKTYREALPFEEWNLKSIQLAKKDAKRTFEINDKGDWLETGQKEGTSPLKDKIRALAGALPHLAPSEWLPETPAELAAKRLTEPAYNVTVKTKDGKPDLTFRLAATGGDKGHFKMEGKSGIGVIPADILTKADELWATPSPPPAPAATPTSTAPAKAATATAPAPATPLPAVPLATPAPATPPPAPAVTPPAPAKPAAAAPVTTPPAVKVLDLGTTPGKIEPPKPTGPPKLEILPTQLPKPGDARPGKP